MLWYKMKNVILFLLLITNLFLAALVLSQEAQVEGAEQNARHLALSFLDDHNISLPDSLLPHTISLPSQEMTWNRNAEKSYAQSLLGTHDEESLGGDILRYHSPQGELRFHDNGEFYATFQDNTYQTTQGNEESLAEEILSLLDFQGSLLERKHENTSLSLTYQQELDTVPLLGCTVTLLFDHATLREISQGKRLQGTFTPTPQEHVSIPSALIYFYNGTTQLGDTSSSITNIQESYLVTTPLSSSATLTAGWLIETDTNSYHLNTQNGTLTRLS